MATPTRYALWFPQPTLPISPFSTAPVGIAVLLVLISQSLPALIIAACLVALGAYFYYRPPGPFYVELADEDLIIQLIRKTRIPYESIAVAGPARYEAGSTMRTIGNAILKRGNWWGSNYPPFGRKGEINPLAVSMTLTRPAILGFAWPRKRVEIPLEDPTDFLADLSHRIAARVDLLEAPPSALPLERRLLNRLQMAVLALTLVQAALFSIWSLLASPNIYRVLATAGFWTIFIALCVLWLVGNRSKVR